MRLGLALGSGGARGWCHIGVLQGLKALGIEPDVVAGCSMGALVGAAWAAGRLDALETWARDQTIQSVLRYVDLRLSRGGLMNGSGLTEVLTEIGVPERFEALGKPFLAIATDMQTGREVWLQDGPLHEAVRGSIAIPGIFSPHHLNGRWLLDGGMTNPVPVSACRALGVDVILAVNPNAKHGRKLWQAPPRTGAVWDALNDPGLIGKLPGPVRDFLDDNINREVPPNYVDVVSVSMDIMTDFLRQTRQAIDPPDLSLEADLNHIAALELYRAAEAIDEGQRLVEQQAEAIRSRLG